jgi:hypothetical protein
MMRRGIPFTAEDERVLNELKTRLEPTHGKIGVTAIVRLAIRLMEKQSA